MNVVVKSVVGYLDHTAMARSYGVLKPGKDKINACLRKHSVKNFTLPKWRTVGEIAAGKVYSGSKVNRA